MRRLLAVPARLWRHKWPRRLIVTAIMIAMLNLAAAGWSNLVYTLTPSVPAKLLVKTPDRPVHRWDYLLVAASDPLIPEGMPLTKKALCLPGDELSFDGLNWYCNGVWLHRVKPATSAGTVLTPFAWEGGIVPPGMIYFGSRHPHGYDSRYLGFAREADVLRLERVL